MQESQERFEVYRNFGPGSLEYIEPQTSDIQNLLRMSKAWARCLVERERTGRYSESGNELKKRMNDVSCPGNIIHLF